MPWGSAWYRGVKVDRYRFRGLKHFLVTLALPGWPFQSNSGWFRVMLLAGPDRGYLTAYVLEYLNHGTPTIQGPLQSIPMLEMVITGSVDSLPSN